VTSVPGPAPGLDGAQAVTFGAGPDYVGVEGDPVADGPHQAGVKDDLAPFILNGRFVAKATEDFSSRSVRIWNNSSERWSSAALASSLRAGHRWRRHFSKNNFPFL
jgi:hypothetical protein